MKFINTKMWFSHKLEQDNKDEEIVELTQADVLKTIDLKVPSKNIKENTQPMNELSNQIGLTKEEVSKFVSLAKQSGFEMIMMYSLGAIGIIMLVLGLILFIKKKVHHKE